MAARVIKSQDDGARQAPRAPAAEDHPSNQADALVAEAQKTVETRLRRANEEAAVLVDSARAQGAEEGRQGAHEALELAETVKQMLSTGLEKDALDCAVGATRELVTLEFKNRPRAIVDVVKKALGSAKHQKEIFVRAHPKDAAILRENKRELLDVLSRARDIDIRDDAALAQGGCFIETELGTVDAVLDSQLERLGRLLLGRTP